MKQTIIAYAAVILSGVNALAGTPDVMIASLNPGGDQDCPILATENESVNCARFAFVDESLQTPVLKSLNKESTLFKIAGKWSRRETSQGSQAPIFVISYITIEE